MPTFPSTLSSSSSLPPSAASLPLSMSSLAASSPSVLITSAAVSNPTNCAVDNQLLRVPLIIFYSLFFLFGLVGNLFALWVFLFLHSSRNSVRVFLINCAIADLVLLACLPFRVFYHIKGNEWVLSSVACKLVGNLFYMNMYVSILLLGLISLDRCLRLNCKARARTGLMMKMSGRSQLWSWVACGTLWGLSLMGLFLMIFTGEDKDNDKDSNRCFQYRQLLNDTGKAYFNGVLVLLFWLIFSVMVVSNAKIGFRLLKVSWDKPQLPNAHRYACTAKKSFFVLFLFTLCFGPYHAFRPVYILSQLNPTPNCDHLHMVDHTNEVMLLLSAFNSCLDPVMYFLLSGSVRKTTLQVLGHRFRPAGNRPHFLNEATSISSTMESRRPSVPVALPKTEANKLSLTPRSSIYAINTTQCHTGLTILPPSGQQ